MESLFSQLVDIFLLPPGVNFCLFGAAFALRKKLPKLSKGLAIFSLSILFLLSLPMVSNSLSSHLQSIAPLSPKQVNQLTKTDSSDIAIVILSGGRRSLAAEYGDIDTVNAATLQRIQYVAWLYRKTQFPILVSGGSVNDEATAESVLINQTMLSAFNIAPRWIESNSKNTQQNAIFSAQILRQQGITRILLVTHAAHIQRAVTAFEKQGIIVIPAPAVFSQPINRWSDYFPSAKALFKSQTACHEQLGRWWYGIGRG